MIKIIGLTGGIGSGKTTIARVFELMGIPVFNSDDHAKLFYIQKEEDLSELREFFGSGVFKDGMVDKKALASIVFNDKSALERLNSIIHPWVKKQFVNWSALQKSDFVIREAAILIESNSYLDCQSIIHVSAPKELRIMRTQKRNSWTRAEVLARMDKQLSEEERLKYCDFEILNDDQLMVIPQIEGVLCQLRKK